MTKSLRIFIVEDEIIAAESLAIDLKTIGHQVIGISGSKQEAIEEILQEDPDLVLMDVKIKDGDGITLAEELNRLALTKIPIVYLTAYCDQETVERIVKSSPYGFIQKPYKIEVLQTVIAIAIDKHNQVLVRESKLLQQQEKLEAFSKYDFLTELPNQLSLVENFNAILEVFYQQVSSSDSYSENRIPSRIPIFYLDFNRFSLIRDEFGTDISNSLFKALVRRLKANLGDETVIARLANYDFCVINPPIMTRQVAIDLARTLLKQITPPFLYKNEEVYIDFNIGISFYPMDGDHITELLNKAKTAVKKTRSLGLNQYKVYSNALHSYRSNEVTLEAQLHKALKEEEFELYYQPKMDIATKEITGAEALLRWNHPEEKFISPAVFIPIAEEIGLINKIGEWVLNTACREFNHLHREIDSNLSIAVNFSARQFNSESLEHKILKVLGDNYFNPNLLEVELTESVLVNNPEFTIKKLNKLKSVGLKVSIDDFGKGYSSLGYLQSFNFDILKIDRVFIKDIDTNSKNASIVKCIIEMAHQLNLRVVAEGVEKESELAFLSKNNCDGFQGYLFSRPLPFAQFKELLLLRLA